MAPIRRYLRITKYSVLEVRIYLDKPSDAPWLLSSKDNVLARIIDEIRPKVLPKLREENENAKRKTSKKKRGIKDVASQDDFEVTIFLTETSTRHSLLTKQKQFTEKPRIQATGTKMTSWLNNSANPIHIGDEDAGPQILQEDDNIEPKLGDIPAAKSATTQKDVADDSDDALFVSSSDEETFLTQRQRPAPRRQRRKRADVDGSPGNDDQVDDSDEAKDDKKKLSLNTTYDGFSIYGRILCLVVKRKGSLALAHSQPAGGSQMMEQWVSTQAGQEPGLDEYDE